MAEMTQPSPPPQLHLRHLCGRFVCACFCAASANQPGVVCRKSDRVDRGGNYFVFLAYYHPSNFDEYGLGSECLRPGSWIRHYYPIPPIAAYQPGIYWAQTRSGEMCSAS